MEGNQDNPKENGERSSQAPIKTNLEIQRTPSIQISMEDSNDVQEVYEGEDFGFRRNRLASTDATKSILLMDDSPEVSRANSVKSGVSSSMSKYYYGSELRENTWLKIKSMTFPLAAIVANVLMLVFVVRLVSSGGIVLNFGSEFLSHSAHVLFLIFSLICHGLTTSAMTSGVAVDFAAKLTGPKGFPIVVCGFLHCDYISKLSFGTNLSFKSRARPVLAKLGVLWFLQLVAIPLALYSSSQLVTERSKALGTSLACLTYGVGSRQTDRKWPTVQLEMGVAEYVFASSLGIMRSENNVSNSTFVMPPQLIDVSDDGSTIRGPGITHTIFTNCTCSYSQTKADLVPAGIDETRFDAVFPLLKNLNGTIGLVNYVEKKPTAVVITSILTGTAACGKQNSTELPVPVCKTSFTNPRLATVEITYMTDGCPASIAAKFVTIVSLGDKISLDWLDQGFRTILDSPGSVSLPPTFPGSINPLLWWTSPNMQVVSPTLLEAGLETTFAMLSKVMIQRTYVSKGQLCPQLVISAQALKITISRTGFIVGMVMVILQLVFTLGALIQFRQWFAAEYPIFPGYRLATDSLYFSALLSQHGSAGFMATIPTFLTKEQIWMAFDKSMRIGESIHTKEDPDFGDIILEPPKMVTELSPTKLYV